VPKTQSVLRLLRWTAAPTRMVSSAECLTGPKLSSSITPITDLASGPKFDRVRMEPTATSCVYWGSDS
jgi:hypothetical protein